MRIIHFGEKENNNQIRPTDIMEDNKLWDFTDGTKLFQEINENRINAENSTEYKIKLWPFTFKQYCVMMTSEWKGLRWWSLPASMAVGVMTPYYGYSSANILESLALKKQQPDLPSDKTQDN